MNKHSSSWVNPSYHSSMNSATMVSHFNSATLVSHNEIMHFILPF